MLSLFYTGNADYGKDEDSAEALLKRHEAFIGDLEGFKNTIEGLKEQATNCRQQETPIVDITGMLEDYLTYVRFMSYSTLDEVLK